ncbi:MAG TPA: transporter [Oxalobacteraceae bacterium]|nr:transporter [Oxalobacteraceae bacterium]
MQNPLRACALAAAVCLAVPAMAAPADALPGGSVQSLLDYARERNPEFAAMRHEAEAASERAAAAGSLPDPKLQIEWRDITKMNTQNPTLAPSRVGTTRYQIMQDLPWFGKRGLQRDIARLEADGAKGLSYGTWAELSSRIKASYAQYYVVHQTEGLAREILDLMARLEKVTQARYAGGLAAQPDAIRAQVEQTSLKNELIGLDNEKRMLQARLNMLLARPVQAPLAPPDRLRPLPPAAQLEFAALEDRVRARNPRLFAEEARIQAAEKNRDLVYKNRYPDFAVGVAPMQTGGSVKEWEVMFQMSIPLQQAPRRAQEREAQAMLAAAQSRKESAANQVLAELAENLSALEAARRTEMLVANSLLPQAELTYRAALASYENGKVDFATLLDAQRQIRMAKQNRFKAQAEGQARLAEIERLLGEDL